MITIKIIKSKSLEKLEEKINNYCRDKAITKEKLVDIKYHGETSCMIIYTTKV